MASTLWLVLQHDAVTITATRSGCAIYYTNKATPALFVSSMLGLACMQGARIAYVTFWCTLLGISMVTAAIIIRQRAAGTSFGYAHHLKQRWRTEQR